MQKIRTATNICLTMVEPVMGLLGIEEIPTVVDKTHSYERDNL